MRFDEAYQHLVKGEHIYRRSWKNDTWDRLSSEDILANDWAFSSYTLTFLEAMQKLLDGKKVTNRVIENAYGKEYYYKAVNNEIQLYETKYPNIGTLTCLNTSEINGMWKVVE